MPGGRSKHFFLLLKYYLSLVMVLIDIIFINNSFTSFSPPSIPLPFNITSYHYPPFIPSYLSPSQSVHSTVLLLSSSISSFFPPPFDQLDRTITALSRSSAIFLGRLDSIFTRHIHVCIYVSACSVVIFDFLFLTLFLNLHKTSNS